MTEENHKLIDKIRGPKAPKDPIKKRDRFYIMRGKSIAASPKDDGSGVCYIYENDGRMISASRLVGGITDEEMLELLTTTEGFRKLVHSIGVTIESENKDSVVQFVFQMYGYKDMYVSGTNIISEIPGNGMEVIIDMEEDVNWCDDDKEPGQIRFEFDKSDVRATVSVCFYLNDGYNAPEQVDEIPVDFNSDEYKVMVRKSLLHLGNNYRLKKAIDKATNGEDTVVAFIGGSITQGAGAVPTNKECYARRVFEGFCELANKGTDENIHYIKAGLGGTPSELGMIRYKKDVLDEGTPDVVIIEFAVNDDGDETKGECYDSLVRDVYDGPGKPAVILLFAVFADDFNLQERLSPVGYAYDLPMVSVKDSVTDQFYKKPSEGRLVSKNQFFYDRYHPSNIGHRIMTDCIIHMMKIALEREPDKPIESLVNISPAISDDFVGVVRIDREVNEIGAVIDCGAFNGKDTDIQCVERNMDLYATPQFADNWMKAAEGGDSPFQMDVEARIILIVFKDSADKNTGKADVYVDGKKTYYANPSEVGWTHCNVAICHRSEDSSMHHVEVRMAEGSEEKKFTILGFGIVK